MSIFHRAAPPDPAAADDDPPALKGADWLGAVLVGCVDTLGRTLLQQAFREFLPPQWASAAGPAIASIAVYVFMAVVLAVRPQGLFPARA